MHTTRQKGAYFEYLAEMFLVKQGFTLIYKNFYTKYGEIDLVCQRKGALHFIEIKCVSRRTFEKGILPEQHVTREKIKKMRSVALIFVQRFDLCVEDVSLDLIAIVSDSISQRQSVWDELNVELYESIDV
jgi:putative endonuclease